jgi:hypothetical protein
MGSSRPPSLRRLILQHGAGVARFAFAERTMSLRTV